ncbi:uncharacterized protein LOC119294530 [Triticum dicoccoides]|uniref:uncharacterized protein LOC119294530 n=1 Tax=Triticum dicoccoides TaxID=85692 RepID=UPI000E78974D|nr:uncharacterized protein LOC119294530 [Triticum dicoccoides]
MADSWSYPDGGGEEKDMQWPPAPPAYGYPDYERPPFVLIDPCAYFADRKNATTAVIDMEAGAPNLRGRLQVTFCAVAPPLVSYFCVHATHMDHTEFAVAPYILATETDGGLVLLCVPTVNPDYPTDHLRPRNCQYFVYDALARKLHQLPQPGFQHRLSQRSLAIMRKPNKSSKNTSNHVSLRPHVHGEAEAEADFVVAAQSYIFWGKESPHICIYDSAIKTWSNKPVVMGSSYPDHHLPSKTLAIGGINGTVAWVDLWHNIIFCDVLAKRPKLRYLKLPSEPRDRGFNPRSVRDIAVFGNTIKYVAMLLRPDDTSSSKVPSCRWMATAWSIDKSRHASAKDWRMVCKLDSTRIMVDAAGTAASFPTLSSLCGSLPTLSLQNDAIVYFLAKIDFSPRQRTAWVLAVDMKNETVEQVVEFPAERTYCVAEGYDASRISAYLQPAPGRKQIHKRPGVSLLKSPSKKHTGDVDAMVE